MENLNVTRKFEGMYGPDMNTELYLLEEKEITEAQYNIVKTVLGVYGPGRQVIKREDGKFYLKSDEVADEAEARIIAELDELGYEYPASE